MNRPHFAGFLVGTLFLGVTLTLAIQHVRAAGIPQTSALSYSGYLASADGTPVNTPQAVNLYFYNAATGGSSLCQVVPGAPTTVTSGRFQIQLPPECTEQVKQNPDLWIEVHVGGISLGRTKLGAVPYAVEAGHAMTADSAFQASSASSAQVAASATNSKHATTADTATNAATATNASNADMAKKVALHGDNITAQDSFGKECFASVDAFMCGVAANRKCQKLGYSGGWIVGESADGTLRSITCIQ